MAKDSSHIAAIDAGSNGIRLAIAEVQDQGKFRIVESIRESVRLGDDSFSRGEFGEITMANAVLAFKRFADFMQSYGVTQVRAVATSAARDALNGQELVDRIRKATDINLEIIDGLEEARLIFCAVSGAVDLKGRTSLLIDMGGGSVEITASRNGRAVGCETLSLGPVRLLQQLRKANLAERECAKLLESHAGVVRDLMHATLQGKTPDVCLGTGGNIECMAKLRIDVLGKVKGGKVKPLDLERLIERLGAMSPKDRGVKYNLREDRSDVIVVACIVLQQILLETGSPRLLIPFVGLKEGLLQQIVDRL